MPGPSDTHDDLSSEGSMLSLVDPVDHSDLSTDGRDEAIPLGTIDDRFRVVNL
jgi:hypothetical protein